MRQYKEEAIIHWFYENIRWLLIINERNWINMIITWKKWEIIIGSKSKSYILKSKMITFKEIKLSYGVDTNNINYYQINCPYADDSQKRKKKNLLIKHFELLILLFHN